MCSICGTFVLVGSSDLFGWFGIWNFACSLRCLKDSEALVAYFEQKIIELNPDFAGTLIAFNLWGLRAGNMPAKTKLLEHLIYAHGISEWMLFDDEMLCQNVCQG